jgi:hypothetical protein
MNFYSLFYLQENDDKVESVNLNSNNHLKIYIDNMFFLSKTLFDASGSKLNVITNNIEKIREIGRDIDKYCDFLELDFDTKIPENAKFYSAHYKLDVLRYFSRLPTDNYIGLIDIDIVCMGKNFENLKTLFERKYNLVYDITEQRSSAYGILNLKKDLGLILGHESEGHWYGGEFIFGSPIFFKKLVVQIDKIYVNYVKNIESLSHHGDEVIVSAAIEMLKQQGISIKSVNNIGIIERYWSVYPKHKQEKLNFYLNNFFLHLPADKTFIADNISLNLPDFINKYKKYALLRKIKSYMKNKILIYVKKP